MAAVQPPEQVEPRAVRVRCDVLRGDRRTEVGDRCRRRGLDHRSLVGDRQEARAEVALLVVGQAPHIGQHDESGQVVALAAERVAGPGAEAWEPRQQEPGVHQIAARAVDVGPRLHRHQERDVVHVAREMRHQAAHPASRLPVPAELERRLEHLAGLAGRRLDVLALAGIELLAGALEERGLVVEQVHLARAPVHEELDDAFGPRRMVEPAAQHPRSGAHRGVGTDQRVHDEHLRQGRAAEPAAETPEELATGSDRGKRRKRGRRIHRPGFIRRTSPRCC